jgi:hypothetical protein
VRPGAVAVTVAATVPAVAYGDLYHPVRATPYALNVMVPPADRSTPRRMLAKQLVVELRDIRVEPN